MDFNHTRLPAFLLYEATIVLQELPLVNDLIDLILISMVPEYYMEKNDDNISAVIFLKAAYDKDYSIDDVPDDVSDRIYDYLGSSYSECNKFNFSYTEMISDNTYANYFLGLAYGGHIRKINDVIKGRSFFNFPIAKGFMFAVLGNHLRLVEYFIRHYDIFNISRATLYAVLFNHKQIVKYFMTQGYSFNVCRKGMQIAYV